MTSIDNGQIAMVKKKRIINIISFIAITLAVSFFVYGIRTGIFKSQEAMTLFLKPFGALTPFIYVMFIAFQSTFMVVPGAVGNLVGVLMFGPVWGILFNYLGNVLGSTSNFFLARFYGADIIRLFSSEKLYNKYKSWLKEDEKKFHKWFAICIFAPFAPDDLLCYLAGMSNMTFKKFITIIILGKPLAVALYSLLLAYGFRNLLTLMGW